MRMMHDLVGDTLAGRYRLVARIAGGGMGEVYRGHDLLLDRPVAVKVLQSALAADLMFVERFRAEARAAARLSHPNVVAIHDWGSEDERTYYMVMEYVAGTDLRDCLVGKRALAPAQAVEVMIAVCEGLAAAHARGLVHRDIKPENVLISRNGDVKVADFGIAAAIDAERTMPGGAISGTLRYLSPEQALGAEATPASDIWAAGAVLCELLTGRPPQQGSGTDLLRRRTSEPPVPPSSVDAKLPSTLDEIVVTACDLDPDLRYPNAQTMAEALRRVQARSVKPAPPLESLLGELTTESVFEDMEPTTLVGRARVRRARRRRAVRRRLMPAILTIALLAAGMLAASALVGPQIVDVPDLVGMTRAQAAEKAGALGLSVEVVERVRDPDAPKGHVVSQNPEHGEVTEGATLKLVVSAGPPRERVPDLLDLTKGQAKVRLSVRHLEVGKLTEKFSLDPAGEVVAQRPDGGKLEWGSKVHLVISKGPRPVAIPSVAGVKSAAARAALEEAGFSVVLVDTYSDDVAPGKVIGTTPAAGLTVPEGSEVRLQVSIGPQFAKLKLPDVRNMSVASARGKLERLGLRVRVVNSCDGGSTVVDTDPIPGTTVRENDVVALFVC